MKQLKLLCILLCLTPLLLSSCKDDESDTGLLLNKATLSLQEGEWETLEPVGGSKDGDKIWISIYPEVATVDGNGKVKAISTGQTTIVLAMDGKSATCEVTVTASNGEPTVYIAGCEEINGVNVATLWKNGEPIRLSDGSSNAEAYSVYVAGKDVYVAGYENIGLTRVATLWKNGDAITLSRSQISRARSIFVDKGKYYIAGDDNKGQTYATLWQSETPKLTHLITTNLSYAYSVFVANNSVYVVGKYASAAIAWKDGVTIPLNSPAEGLASSSANSVYVAGNDVYVAGDAYVSGKNGNVAMLWKNGTPNQLTDGDNEAIAHTVFVDGGKVYVGGYETSKTYQKRATIWENGNITYLTLGNDLNRGNAEVHSLFVLNGNVYAAGYERVDKSHYIAALWENGTVTYLGDLQGTSCAYSVFVLK